MLTTATYISNRFFKRLAIAILLVCTVQVQAQNSNFLAAEKLYNKGDYYSALSYYKAFLNDEKATKTINKFTGYLSRQTGSKAVPKNAITNTKLAAILHLAASYRLLSDFENASAWYDSAKQVKGWENYPDIEYWQGVSLRASGNATLAKEVLTHYISVPADKCLYTKEARKELADMDFAVNELALKKRRRSIATKMASPINGSESNYAGSVVGDQLYFSSTRPDSNTVANRSNPYQHHLYKATLVNAGEINKIVLQQNLNTEQGAASFTVDGKIAYFTQWEIVNGKKIGAIYTSHVTDTSWSKPLKLDTLVNKPNYTSQQPFITTDGKFLYFASDRVGGKGKFDIWCAELDKNGAVKKVTDLPATINSAENEKSPFFYSTTQTLVFASDGWIGMGGYDVFSSKQVGSVFAKAVNLGSPINTTKDDMYFFAKENTSNMIDDVVLSSDRDSKCCLELFNIHRLPAPINSISGAVRNSETKEPITQLSFNWATNNATSEVSVNNKGNYKIVVPDTVNYLVTVSSTGYADTSAKVSHVFSTPEDSILYQDFYLTPLPPIVATLNKDYTIYFEFDKATLTDSAKLALDSLAKHLLAHSDWKLQIDGFTDSKGADTYNLKLSKKRSESCAQYLKALNINDNQLVTSFFGEAMPIAPNTTENGKDNPTGRELNRRVTLTLIIP